MARDEAPLFPRGGTYHGGDTIDANDLGGTWLEGKEWLVEDTINGTGAYVRLRCVRNVSGISLYPKRLVRYKDGYFGRRVDGYTTTTNEAGYPVDDAYGSTPIANNDLFWIVVDGPCKVVNGTTVATTTVVAERDPLSALTAAASTGASTTDAGRVRTVDMSGATAVLGNAILSIFGRAMSAAATSGVTNTDILSWVTKHV